MVHYSPHGWINELYLGRLVNSETIGSVTINYGTGSAAAAALGAYTGSVVPSAATGGTFKAANYSITYTAGTLTVGKAVLTITAGNVSKAYGNSVTGGSGSKAFTSTGLQNSQTISSVTSPTVRVQLRLPTQEYSGSVTPSAAAEVRSSQRITPSLTFRAILP